MSTRVELKAYPVALGRERLEGEVAVPGGATGLVIFAHGSGSSRFSPRNILAGRWFQRHFKAVKG